jgi:hypothetical protein
LWNKGYREKERGREGERERGGRDVRANRPDIIIKNKNGKICVLTGVSILAEGNVTQKEAES